MPCVHWLYTTLTAKKRALIRRPHHVRVVRVSGEAASVELAPPAVARCTPRARRRRGASVQDGRDRANRGFRLHMRLCRAVYVDAAVQWPRVAARKHLHSPTTSPLPNNFVCLEVPSASISSLLAFATLAILLSVVPSSILASLRSALL